MRTILLAFAGSACFLTSALAQTGVGIGPVPSITKPRPGQVWLVPQGGRKQAFPTIQAAVDAASPGDTVLLSAGSFRGPGNHNVVVSGKDIRIEGEAGAADCVIDCERKGRAFFFEGPAITGATILREISIIRGDVSPSLERGGGIYCSDESWPTIEDCVISDCHSAQGGAIRYLAVGAGLGVVRRCTLRSNEADDGGGGGSSETWSSISAS